MLRIEDLTLRFADQAVLRQVSLNVPPGIHVVIGLNGSGKSSLLKATAGIWRPDQGRVFIGDRDVTNLPPEARAVGYVPQHPALFPHMTVERNLRYALRNGRGDEETIQRLVDVLDLQDVLNKKPTTLSGGYQSRVSLARTLASKPEALLLDEPLSDLDVAIKERLLPDFKSAMTALGAPVLYVTHDALEAESLGNGFSVMIRGELNGAESAQAAFETIRAKVF